MKQKQNYKVPDTNDKNDAINAWLSYMQILRTIQSFMAKEYKRKMKQKEPITWENFNEVNNSLKTMLNKAYQPNKSNEYTTTSSNGKEVEYTNNQQIKENKMKKKQVVRLNESQLNRIIKESVKKVLKESATPNGTYDKYGNENYDYTLGEEFKKVLSKISIGMPYETVNKILYNNGFHISEYGDVNYKNPLKGYAEYNLTGERNERPNFVVYYDLIKTGRNSYIAGNTYDIVYFDEEGWNISIDEL